MSITFSSIKNWVIITLIVVVVLLRACQPKPTDLTNYIEINGTEYELLSHKRDTIYLDTVVEVPVYIPVQPEPIPQPIPQEVDTLAILNDYYAKYAYNDEIKIDSMGMAYIRDTISQNKILSRNVRFDIEYPSITETITVKEPPVNKVYVGGTMGFDRPSFINHISANGLFITKTDKVYGLGIGASAQNINGETGITPYIEASMYWKISLRRKR